MPARRILTGVLTALVALAGVAALLLFFQSRDRSTVGGGEPKGPGREYPDQGDEVVSASQAQAVTYNSRPPTSGPHVRALTARYDQALDTNQALTAMARGNVVIWVRDRGDQRAALRLARAYDEPTLRGSGFRALAGAGQAVLVSPGKTPARGAVVVSAWRHLLPADSADDPAVKDFVDFWLGRGAR